MKNNYQQLEELITKEGVPYFIPDQVKSLFRECRNYLMYYNQYKNLKLSQKILSHFYDNGEARDDKLPLFSRMLTEVLLQYYIKIHPEKKPTAAKSDFVNEYLLKPEELQKKMYQMGIDKGIVLGYHKEICEFTKEGNNPIEALNTGSYIKALELLKENQKPIPVTNEEGFEEVLSEGYKELLASMARKNTVVGYINIYFYIAWMRRALTDGEIKNHTPSDRKKKNHVFFKKSFSKNTKMLKASIKKILDKYPDDILKEYEDDKEAINQVKRKIGLL